MISEDKIRNSFSRIKLDFEMLKNAIIEARNNILELKQNQSHLITEINRRDSEYAYEIRWLKDKMEILEKQLQYERSLKNE